MAHNTIAEIPGTGVAGKPMSWDDMGRTKAAKRYARLRALATDAPMRWTWEGIVAEERHRTLMTVFLMAAYLEARRTPREPASRVLHLYLMLWRQRERWCGAAPARDIARLAARAPDSVRREAAVLDVLVWTERRAEALRPRVGQVAAFALREPRPIQGPLRTAAELVENGHQGARPMGEWQDLRRLVSGEREDVDCRRHERVLLNALQAEARKILDPSLRAIRARGMRAGTRPATSSGVAKDERSATNEKG